MRRIKVNPSTALVVTVVLTSLVLYGDVAAAQDFATARTIVLIGGAKSHGPGEHDFPNGIRLLQELLESSPDLKQKIQVKAYPDGWPKDAAVVEDAATMVWYFDGLEGHPLFDANRRTQFERLMKKGVGVVAFHQASTLPPGDKTIDLPHWLGGARYGMFDSTIEAVEFKPAATHPISRGVGTFTYMDEFYPTINFNNDTKGFASILSGKLHPQFQNSRPLVIDKPTIRTVAWAFERDSGGRSFAFTGLHFLRALDEPELRKLLLNAIVWTAGIEVPEHGIQSGASDSATKIMRETYAVSQKTVTEAVVTRSANNKVVEYPWGHLTWYASRELNNSETMTVGQAVIRPGQANPRHFHPNCDEVLHVLKGDILHSMGDRTVEMHSGDTVSIPVGVMHNAKNIGKEDAVLEISFSSADRQVVGE